jgi:hypothetical protein
MLQRSRLILVAPLLLCACTRSVEPPPKQEGMKASPPVQVAKAMNTPFMEHPTGKFNSAVDAMTDAIERLRALPEWRDWITFGAQGMGERVDSYQFAEIRMLKDTIKLQQPIALDTEAVTKRAGVSKECLSGSGDTYSIAAATPAQAARVMDAIFRQYLKIRPFPDEDNDYAVGAEW